VPAVPDAPTPNEPSKPSLLRKVLRWTVFATVGLLVALLAMLLVRPELLLFYPSSKVAHTPDEMGWAHDRVEIETEDGETIVGWFLPASPGPVDRPWVVLYCHGNGGNIGDRLPLLAGLRELGLAVLIFDYRGYGESSGRASVDGTRLDVIAAWRHLVDERGYDPSEIVLWGRSLGGAVAIDQAARLTTTGMPPAALVVESTFTSTVDIGRELYPWLPVGLFARKIDYPSLELIATVQTPVLIGHSQEDELIPYAHGLRLREAAEAGAATRVQFIELAGGHNEGFLGEVWYLERVTGFLLGRE
jgi:alpha-beta hydrolase superfamily lysophospholipase